MANLDVASLVGTWVAAIVALVALIGIIGPILVWRASRTQRHQALARVGRNNNGFLSRGIRAGPEIYLLVQVKAPHFKNAPSLDHDFSIDAAKLKYADSPSSWVNFASLLSAYNIHPSVEIIWSSKEQLLCCQSTVSGYSALVLSVDMDCEKDLKGLMSLGSSIWSIQRQEAVDQFRTTYSSFTYVPSESQWIRIPPGSREEYSHGWRTGSDISTYILRADAQAMACSLLWLIWNPEGYLFPTKKLGLGARLLINVSHRLSPIMSRLVYGIKALDISDSEQKPLINCLSSLDRKLQKYHMEPTRKYWKRLVALDTELESLGQRDGRRIVVELMIGVLERRISNPALPIAASPTRGSILNHYCESRSCYNNSPFRLRCAPDFSHRSRQDRSWRRAKLGSIHSHLHRGHSGSDESLPEKYYAQGLFRRFHASQRCGFMA